MIMVFCCYCFCYCYYHYQNHYCLTAAATVAATILALSTRCNALFTRSRSFYTLRKRATERRRRRCSLQSTPSLESSLKCSLLSSSPPRPWRSSPSHYSLLRRCRDLLCAFVSQLRARLRRIMARCCVAAATHGSQSRSRVAVAMHCRVAVAIHSSADPGRRAGPGGGEPGHGVVGVGREAAAPRAGRNGQAGVEMVRYRLARIV